MALKVPGPQSEQKDEPEELKVPGPQSEQKDEPDEEATVPAGQ